jgi:hypothetical protein
LGAKTRVASGKRLALYGGMDVTKSRMLLSAGIVLWLAIIGAGFERMWRYSATPGPEAAAASMWPTTAFAHDTERPTLVMFLHPDCGCSPASLGELARLVAKSPLRFSALVLFGDPMTGELLSDNAMWRTAAAIPGVTPIHDPGGREAATFDARVSGQTFLYDEAGRLAFSGGMTGRRGHAGDNDGEDALFAFITHGTSSITRTPVFGCLLERRSQS